MATHYNGPLAQRLSLDVYVKMMRATRALDDWVAASVAPFELTDSQFGVLETLYHLGPLKPSQIAAKHLTSRNNLTVIVDNLEGRGLVRRDRDLVDRRAIYIHLTDEGTKLLEKALPVFAGTVAERMSVLTADEQTTLASLLKRLGLQDRGQQEDREAS